LTKIWDKAFTDTGLKSVTIPEGVTGIGFCAFESCGDLTSVTIPASVKAINEAFLDCCDLETIRFNGTKAQWEKVVKSGLWDFNVPAKSVTCTDGAVKLLK
jgi:hypothetical protein